MTKKMTERDYFTALRKVLSPALKDAPKAKGGHYLIEEPNQTSFELNTRGLIVHQAIKPEALKADWACFRTPHPYAHKRCDRVIVAWDRLMNCPKYLLIELKSGHPGTAHKQLGASLAFCHFLHQMVCVGQIFPPSPLFGSMTVRCFSGALKYTSPSTIPNWNNQPLQPDCKHMHYPRSRSPLPVREVLDKIQ